MYKYSYVHIHRQSNTHRCVYIYAWCADSFRIVKIFQFKKTLATHLTKCITGYTLYLCKLPFIISDWQNDTLPCISRWKKYFDREVAPSFIKTKLVFKFTDIIKYRVALSNLFRIKIPVCCRHLSKKKNNPCLHFNYSSWFKNMNYGATHNIQLRALVIFEWMSPVL